MGISYIKAYGDVLARREGGYLCHYCGIQCYRVLYRGLNVERQATADHKRPKCQGGKSELDNLVLACRACNLEKGEGDYLGFWKQKESLRMNENLKRAKRRLKRGK
jgi:5-methylcytosine-specific restriction endonuclease McrA